MISIYDIGNEDFTSNGNAVLTPLKCSHRQVAAGKYDLSITHPLDEHGKWTHIVPDAIIKAPVPVETITNAYSGMEADVYKTNQAAAMREEPREPAPISYSAWVAGNTYNVGDKVSVSGYSHRNYQCIQFDSGSGQVMVPPPNSSWWKEIADSTSGAPVMINMKTGTELFFVEDAGSGWYKMSTLYGMEGYVKSSQLTYDRHLTPAETQPRKIKTQLFRVRTVNVDSKSRTITATAEHVSYDMSGVLVKDAKIVKKNPAFALAWIEQSFMIDYRGTIATNMTDDENGTYTGEIKGKNAIYALLDPDKGIVSTFDATFRRDNWDVFVLAREETDKFFDMRYRKNMLGVSWNIKNDGSVNRVVPVAKAEDGSDLYLPEMWVDSPLISQQAVIRMERIKVNGQVGKDDGTESGTVWTEEALLEEMRTKAEERFTIDKADQTVHDVTIDFEMLGATDEYRRLRSLENVLLYDKVIAHNDEIKLSIEAEVTEIEFDCIKEKVTALKLSNVSGRNDRTVSGFNVFNNSITGDKLTDDAIDSFDSTGITDEAHEYADSRVNNMNLSIRQWVTNNFVAQ